ncbi:MAG TPA: hypothetical protein VGM20_13825 [Gemmatimonadales bacterium]|jgi:hypothetical protein
MPDDDSLDGLEPGFDPADHWWAWRRITLWSDERLEAKIVSLRAASLQTTDQTSLLAFLEDAWRSRQQPRHPRYVR